MSLPQVGDTFGYYTIIDIIDETEYGEPLRYVCLCGCGAEETMLEDELEPCVNDAKRGPCGHEDD